MNCRSCDSEELIPKKRQNPSPTEDRILFRDKENKILKQLHICQECDFVNNWIVIPYEQI